MLVCGFLFQILVQGRKREVKTKKKKKRISFWIDPKNQFFSSVSKPDHQLFSVLHISVRESALCWVWEGVWEASKVTGVRNDSKWCEPALCWSQVVSYSFCNGTIFKCSLASLGSIAGERHEVGVRFSAPLFAARGEIYSAAGIDTAAHWSICLLSWLVWCMHGGTSHACLGVGSPSSCARQRRSDPSEQNMVSPEVVRICCSHLCCFLDVGQTHKRVLSHQ